MGRLIDADTLIGKLLTENQRCITSTGHELTMSMVVSFIKDQPTAYDPDKVVEEIKRVRNMCLECKHKNCENCMIYKINKIVRKGGVHETD